MKFAKGPNGFRVRVKPNVTAMVKDISATFPDFHWRWDAVLAYLRANGHHGGYALDKTGFRRAGVLHLGKWNVSLVWTVLGDTVVIEGAEF